MVLLHSMSSANQESLQRLVLVLLEFLMCSLSFISISLSKLTGNPMMFWSKTKLYGSRRMNIQVLRIKCAAFINMKTFL